MQTFLPYPDFVQSANALDYRRLGCQRKESFQILQTLYGISQGWKNHPAVKMWQGYEEALLAYYSAVCREWIRRGYKNTMPIIIPTEDYLLPHWFGNEDFHDSHKSMLWQKDSTYYAQWEYLGTREYIWPV